VGTKPKIPVWKWREAILRSDLPALTKLLLLAISHHLSDATVGRTIRAKDLARETGMSERSITTHIKNAVKAGLLSAVYVHDAKGHRSAYNFTPIMPEIDEGLSENDAPRMSDLDAPNADSQVRLDANDDNLSAADAGRESGLGAGDAPQVSFQEKSFLSFQEREPRAPKHRRKGGAKTILPETAELDPGSDAMRFALEKGLTETEAIEEFRRFRDYQRSHAKPYADQFAAWRNWLSMRDKFKPRSNGTARVSDRDRARKAFMEG
jgi:hypothetical protein